VDSLRGTLGSPASGAIIELRTPGILRRTAKHTTTTSHLYIDFCLDLRVLTSALPHPFALVWNIPLSFRYSLRNICSDLLKLCGLYLTIRTGTLHTSWHCAGTTYFVHHTIVALLWAVLTRIKIDIEIMIRILKLLNVVKGKAIPVTGR
jgi:hypothetical protein